MRYVGAMKMCDLDTWSKVSCDRIGSNLMSNEVDSEADWCGSYIVMVLFIWWKLCLVQQE